MRDLATAIALMLVIEGVLYALFPRGMKRVSTEVAILPAGALRITGLVAATTGVAIVWFIRR